MFGNNQAIDLVAETDRIPFVIDKFHGILGTKDCVVKGKIRIVIEWADDVVLLRDNVSVGYEIAKPTLIIKSEIEENVNDRIEFDNFTSQFQLNESENQTTNIYIGSRDIEYVLATFLPDDYYSKISTQYWNGTSYFFSHGLKEIYLAQGPVYVGFSINNVPIANHPIPYDKAIE